MLIDVWQIVKGVECRPFEKAVLFCRPRHRTNLTLKWQKEVAPTQRRCAREDGGALCPLRTSWWRYPATCSHLFTRRCKRYIPPYHISKPIGLNRTESETLGVPKYGGLMIKGIYFPTGNEINSTCREARYHFKAELTSLMWLTYSIRRDKI